MGGLGIVSWALMPMPCVLLYPMPRKCYLPTDLLPTYMSNYALGGGGGRGDGVGEPPVMFSSLYMVGFVETPSRYLPAWRGVLLPPPHLIQMERLFCVIHELEEPVAGLGREMGGQ